MALQHLRSSTANKRPTPGSMADGQLAVNTAATSPGVFFKDAAGNLVKAGPVHVGTSAPNVSPASGGHAGNSTGELWLDTTGTDYTLKTWDGSAWREIVVTSTMIKDGTIVNADINASAAIVDTKLATIATAGKVSNSATTAASANTTNAIVARDASGNFSAGTITANLTGTASAIADNTVTSAKIVDGTIVNADINASAAIVDTKLATISTAGKVSGTAITSGDIATSGNLLITSSTPVVRLTESDGTATHSQTSLARDSDQFAIQTRSSTGAFLSSDYVIPANASGATDHVWRIAGTEKARLNSTGLTVVDDLTISDKIIHAGDTNTAIRFPAADTIAFETDGSEAMRIGANGRVGIGTTAPTEELQVIGTIRSIDFRTSDFSSVATAGTDAGFYADGNAIQASRDGNTCGFFRRTSSNGAVFDFRRDTTTVGTISVTTTATAYNTSSDYRLKENIIPLAGAITRLNQLPVYRFNFIADPDTLVDGFIAHEAAAIVPECVTGEKDEEDENGNPVYQGIDQSKIVPLLTAALQEAIAKIEALETRIAALES